MHQLPIESGMRGNEPVDRSFADTALPTSVGADDHLQSCVEGIVRGEESALAALYDATLGRVYGVALRILRSAEAAEEVVSDVYFQAWREAARYDRARGPVQTWLLMICRTRALDTLRRRDPAFAHPAPHDLVASHDDQKGDLQDLLEATQECSKVRAALAALPALQRQVLALAFFRAYTYAEVASHFDMPLGSVKTLIRGALRKLRGAIDGKP